jgi:signal peptide peptidase SppA
MSGRTLAHLADQVLNRPLLLAPEKLSIIMAALDGRLGFDAVDALTPIPEASRFIGSRTERRTGAALSYSRTDDGVAIIPLIGSFVNRGAYIGASSGVISYEGVAHQLRQAGADPKVRAVILDLESGGGQALGAFETARAVRDLAAAKPVTAVVNGMACSAAYAIASAATRIVTTESGISGSIGVVLLHVNRQDAMTKAGLKPTFIHAGAHKVDGNPYQALSDDARAGLQAEIDTLMAMFVGCVAAGRKNLTEAAVRATEARTFMGQEAVAAGLADAVGSFESALADLSGGRTRQVRRAPQHPPLSTRSTTKMEDEEKAIRADERARVKAITSAPEARGREKQALALALSTGLAVEEAVEIMAASPAMPAAGSDAASFGARMDARRALELDAEPATAAGPDAIVWDDIAADTNTKAGVSAPSHRG